MIKVINVTLKRSDEQIECYVCGTGIDNDDNYYEVRIHDNKKKICIDCGNEFTNKFDEAHEEMYGW